AIWLALVIYSVDSLKARNEKRKLALNERLNR
ncbi:MAG: hypothetical protein ACJA0T_001494, partial [Colwellia sp.]